jgi:hypothetical protein
MQPLLVKDYKPPFITETDEKEWDDCTVCSTLMAVASATLGEVTSAPDWSDLGPAGLKVRREKIRNHLPADKQKGGLTNADMVVAFEKEFPWLPTLPVWSAQKNTWEETVKSLLGSGVAVLNGNPAAVTNVNSKLRRWTNNDKFNHAILAERARRAPDQSVDFFIMDPLGSGKYDGEWVPAQEVRQFIFKEAGGVVQATIFKRGAWAKSAERVAALSADLADAKARLQQAQADNLTLASSLEKANQKRAAAKTALTGIGVAVDNASELVRALEATL